MLLFNSHQQLTYSQIKHNLGKLSPYLTSHLIPLCKPGSRQILQKQPLTESFKDSDIFTVLQDFTSKKRKLTYNTMQRREAKEDIDQTREKVLNERLFAIESNIVRILKEKKKQNHQKIVQQVLETLRLPLTGKEIAKCIDGLIQREYMRRDDNNPQLYHYIA